MKIDRAEFISALSRVKPAWASGGVVAELSHVWFDKKAVFAFDGGFGIRLALTTELDGGIPGSPLLGLLNTSTLKEASLDIAGTSLQVKLGKAVSKLSAYELDRAVWPYPAKLPKGAAPTALNEEFIEALRKTLFIKASPPTRVEHHGVTVQRSKNDIELYATDSATMACVRLAGVGKGASFERTLLPRAFAEQIVSQCPEGVKLYVFEDYLVAEGDGVSFYSNLMDISGSDDMAGIMTKKGTLHPTTVPLPVGLEGALARAEILAGAQEPAVELATDGASLSLTGDYALGTLKETLPMEGKLPSVKLRIKAGSLKRALVHAEGFSIEKGSLLLRGEPDFAYLIAAL